MRWRILLYWVLNVLVTAVIVRLLLVQGQRGAIVAAARAEIPSATCGAGARSSVLPLQGADERRALEPRLALLFLITDRIEHEDIWIELLARGGRGTGSEGAPGPLVLVHAAASRAELRRRGMSPYFLQRLVPTPVATRWGDLVGAMRALLRAALAAEAATAAAAAPRWRVERFAFVSDTTVPLASVRRMQRVLLEQGRVATGHRSQCSAFCFAPVADWPSPQVPKAHQWSVLAREHAVLLAADTHGSATQSTSSGLSHRFRAFVNGMLLRAGSRRAFQSDEVEFTAELWRRGRQAEAVHSCHTFVWWGERSWFNVAPALLSLSRMTRIGSHPATFEKVPYAGLRELVMGHRFLFARKFERGTAVTGAPPSKLGPNLLSAALLRLIDENEGLSSAPNNL
jgi:hypothetical protein